MAGRRRIAERARAFIGAHRQERISVDAVAAAAGTLRRALFRVFLEILGETPALHARRLRLHRVGEVLAAAEEPATSVSVLAGK